MTLYHYYRSSSSYRVRIALNLKKIKAQLKPVHLLNEGGEQFFSNYLNLNPKAEVPCLEEGAFTLSQSVAIIEYLDESKPEPELYPKDLKQKAFVRQCIEVINSGIQPIQNLAVLKKLKADFGLDESQKIKWIQNFIQNGFMALELMLEKHSLDPFLFSKSPGAFECFLIPQIYNAERFEVNMDLYPLLKKINKECLTLDAFKEAHPSQFESQA